MKRASGYRTTMVWWAVAVVILLAGEAAWADFTFGEPVNLGPTVNSEAWEYTHCVSADNLELYFGSYREGGYGASDIWLCTRETTEEAWGPPQNLGAPINTDGEELGVCLSADGLELYFQSWRPGGLGAADIWVTRRAARGEPWGDPVNLGSPVNSEIDEYNPCLSGDGLELYFVFGQADPEAGPTQVSIGVARRETKDDPWGEPESLGPIVNNWSCQDTPWISSDGRILVFTDFWVCEPRPGGYGGTDIWLTRRVTKDGEWSEPVNLGPGINTGFDEDLSMISADGSMLYFDSDRPGGSGEGDLWQATIIPIVDFNGDGMIDLVDLAMLIDHWGTDDPLCDIGPMPWGDGVVDVQDLKVLAEYIGEPVDDPTLVAHWALDETEGIAVQDLARGNNGTILGLPQWRPQGGRIGGALELNGTTFVTAKPARSPADGPFSVLAWIKGGAPGQTVISQAGGANWLAADGASGALMTELSKSGRTGDGLSSQGIITDDNWHRIAFTWDGANRRLHVDGVLAAGDAQDSLAPSSGNVIIGAAQNMAPGTFWTGLIDDVRVYNRTVKP